MKRALVYGTNNAKYPRCNGFQISADGSIDLALSGVNILEIEENEDIRWIDIFYTKLNKLVSNQERLQFYIQDDRYDNASIYEKYCDRLFDSLKIYCNPKSQVEKDFFGLYCSLCLSDNHFGAYLPALIPNVYINWDYSQETRQKKEKPYIVDFVFKSSVFGTKNLVILEIDGFSHYAKYDFITKKQIACEKLYAEHLKKDRWLRKQEFKVFRIGNADIQNIMSYPDTEKTKYFYYLFKDVFGEEVLNLPIDIFGEY